MDLEQFLRAYIIAALWSSNDGSDESGGEPMDSNYDADDLAPATLVSMREDCAKFLADNAADLALYEEARPGNEQYSSADLAGHDFWLTRNGHGVGFWDRDIGELGDRLTTAAHAFTEVDLYVGDDGMIYS